MSILELNSNFRFSSSRRCNERPCQCGCCMSHFKEFVWPCVRLGRKGMCQSTYHQMLNGSSKRVIRIPWSSFRALSPKACFPVIGVSPRGSRSLSDSNGSDAHTLIWIEAAMFLGVKEFWLGWLLCHWNQECFHWQPQYIETLFHSTITHLVYRVLLS